MLEKVSSSEIVQGADVNYSIRGTELQATAIDTSTARNSRTRYYELIMRCDAESTPLMNSIGTTTPKTCHQKTLQHGLVIRIAFTNNPLAHSQY